MPKRPVYPLIFTDLDGTLLDHDSYSAKPADLLIQQIIASSLASIIPITSKTRAEWRSLQQSIPLAETVSVTENGSAIHTPRGLRLETGNRPQIIMLGIEYEEIVERINKLPPFLRQHITGFSDMSVAEVAAATGLGTGDALLAKNRQASEPFLWSGSDAQLEELEALMTDADIRIQRGGRFYHFTGHATKQQAMALIKAAFAAGKPDTKIVSIALGDGPNDLAMIEAADFGVIMPNPEGVTIESSKPRIRTAPVPGPQGWVLAVREIFAELGLNLQES